MPAVKPDPTLKGALDLAREAAESIAEAGTVGEHLGMEMVQDRVATHYFACTAKAYPGWRWAITVARVPRSKVVTVSETNLVPGDGALLSPEWLPYADRLAPGDIGPGDVTPKIDDDPLLEAGFEATGDEDVDQVALHEARPRPSASALRRGPRGRGPALVRRRPRPERPGRPEGAGSVLVVRVLHPDGRCPAVFFGVCANAWSPSDGSVVSLDHGCGAHSEVDMDAPEPEVIAPPVLDDTQARAGLSRRRERVRDGQRAARGRHTGW